MRIRVESAKYLKNSDNSKSVFIERLFLSICIIEQPIYEQLFIRSYIRKMKSKKQVFFKLIGFFIEIEQKRMWKLFPVITAIDMSRDWEWRLFLGDRKSTRLNSSHVRISYA